MIMYLLKTKLGIIGIETSAKGISKICLSPKRITINEKLQIDKNLNNLIKQLKDYFQGARVNFKFKYDIKNLSKFTQKVLTETKKIRYGSTATYKEIAKRIGCPKAFRAVGQALSSNPLPIIIPCHRVLRKDGSIGGFAAGLKWKKMLLKLESVKL